MARLLRSRNASSVGGAFVSLSSSDIVRASVGSGEKMVVLAFETAQMNAPSVVFIDEFQALFTERSSGGSRRLSSTLLQCMDDVKQWRDVVFIDEFQALFTERSSDGSGRLSSTLSSQREALTVAEGCQVRCNSVRTMSSNGGMRTLTRLRPVKM